MACEIVEVRNDMTEFKACTGSTYLSLNYHHGAPDRHKTKWALAREEECGVFCHAQEQDWDDGDENLWSIGQNGSLIYGKTQERMAFFDGSNASDTWHGFPVSGRSGTSNRRRPPQTIAQRWLNQGHINKATYERIVSGRL